MSSGINDLAHCIYCDRMVARSSMTDEHIWPEALGGDALPAIWRTRVCGGCNNISGVYVDGAFIKSWIGAAERAADAEEYLSPTQPDRGAVPFHYMGVSNDAATREGEVADLWVGPCGAIAIHFRPVDETTLFRAYAGGDPRKGNKRATAGRAYLAIMSREPFWQSVAIASFQRQFRRAQHCLVTQIDASLTTDMPLPDRENPDHLADIGAVQALLEAGSIKARSDLDLFLGGRFQAKLALAIGYQLFGEAFGRTDYCKELRRAFREGDPAKRKGSKVRGSGILTGATLGGAEEALRWPGGWLLLIKQSGREIALCVISPSGKCFTVLVCDEMELVASLGDRFEDGVAWLAVPAIDEAVGPIGLPEFLAHRLGAITHPELAALEARFTNPSNLPDRGL